jgi:hypothetical protein
MRIQRLLRLAGFSLILAALPAVKIAAQQLTLEGQTGGFITPTAYVVYSARGSFSRIRRPASILSMLRR